MLPHARLRQPVDIIKGASLFCVRANRYNQAWVLLREIIAQYRKQGISSNSHK
jgi:hypothetical protein